MYESIKNMIFCDEEVTVGYSKPGFVLVSAVRQIHLCVCMISVIQISFIHLDRDLSR